MSTLPLPPVEPDEPLTRRPSRLATALTLVRSIDYVPTDAHLQSPIGAEPSSEASGRHAHFDSSTPSGSGSGTPNGGDEPGQSRRVSSSLEGEKQSGVKSKKDEKRERKKKQSVIDIEHVPVEDDPRMWSGVKKNTVLFMIIMALFAPQMIPSLFNPIIDEVRKALNASDTQIGLSISMFILIQGGMPPFWTTVAEIIGRKPVYLITSWIYLIGSIVASTAKTMPLLIGMRALQAVGSSGAVAVGAGTLADMFDTHERGTKLGWYYGVPLLSPALGPLIGGALGQAFGWRSPLYFIVAFAGFTAVMFIFMPETWRKERSRIYQHAVEKAIRRALSDAESDERKRKRKLAKGLASNAPTPPITPGTQTPATRRTSVDDMVDEGVTEADTTVDSTPTATTSGDEAIHTQRKVIVDTERNEVILLRRDWRYLGLRRKKVEQREREEEHEEVRPSLRDINPLPIMVSIFRQPTNAIVLLGSGVFFAASYTIVYTASVTLAAAPYSYNALFIGVTLLSFGIGNIVGSIAGGRWSDISLKRQRAARGGVMVPEMRLKSTLYFMPFMVGSFLSYAWTAGEHVHVAGIVVSLFFAGLFLLLIYSSTLAYVVDANPGRASAAVGANSFCRGISACIMSQIAIPAQNAIGDGGLYTLFAGLLALSSGMMALVAFTGESWRDTGRPFNKPPVKQDEDEKEKENAAQDASRGHHNADRASGEKVEDVDGEGKSRKVPGG